MTNKSEKLIDKCLEIEGLLSLISQRGEKIENGTSGFKEIHSLLLNKTETLLDEIRQLGVAPSTDNEKTGSVEYEEAQMADKNTELPPPLPEEEESSVKVIPPPIPLQHEEEISIETEPDPDSTIINNEETEEIDIPETDEENVDNATAPTKPRKIQFSVNDKFRFRRELFNFSDEEMAEAIEIACQMNTVEEIEDYFYNDLCFDPENEDVIDFIKILTSSIK